MKPNFTRKGWGRLITVVCLIALAFWIGQKGDPFTFFSHPVILSGSVPEVVHQSQQIQHANPEAQLDIVVGLKVQDEAALDALIVRQQDPKSSDYHQFLSVEQYTERFSPTTGQVDDVVKFLTANGITVKKIYRNRLLIQASGSVAQLEKAFNITINEYELPPVAGNAAAAVRYFSNDTDPTVPGFLKNIVQSVIGLNTLAAYQSHMRMADGARPTWSSYQEPLSPQDVATAYNFPNENNTNAPAKKYSGRGVTLAIATANVYDHADVETYWRQHGIRRFGAITDVYINGKSKVIEDETTLDLELAGSQAPGADIMMYMAASPAFLNFTLTYAQIVIDDKADVMTVSWGMCEDRSMWMQVATDDMLFREAEAQGIALFASAGDDGAYDCGIKDKKHLKLGVDFPSSSPYVTAVGGTALHIDEDSARTSETTWDSGGGGISTSIDRPSWQVGFTLPPGNKRATTDVSLDADPWTGYSFYFQGKWMRMGGTSASSPEWAALWTLVLEATGQRVGSANFYVYEIGSLIEYHKYFYDVTVGDNGAGVGPGFKAGPGWDIPTGWGTPDGAALIDWMIQITPKRPPEDKSLGQKHPGLMFSRIVMPIGRERRREG